MKWEILSDLLADQIRLLWFTENYTLCSLNQHHLVISGNLVWKWYTISHFSCLCSYVDQQWSQCYTAYQSEWQEGSQKHLDWQKRSSAVAYIHKHCLQNSINYNNTRTQTEIQTVPSTVHSSLMSSSLNIQHRGPTTPSSCEWPEKTWALKGRECIVTLREIQLPGLSLNPCDR